MKDVLCIAGPFPPPRHGVSAINEVMCALVVKEGFSVDCYNTAPTGLSRTLFSRMSRFPRVALAILGIGRFAKKHPGAAIYCSLSSGYGLIGELLMIRAARKGGCQIVLHHHSYRYLDCDQRLMKLVVSAAGSGALHVVLSGGMEKALRMRYPGVVRSLVLSNVAFFGDVAPNTAARGSCKVVGFISNLSPSKGVWDVVELAEHASKKGSALTFRLAGPFQNREIEKEFFKRTKDLKNISYLGPLYGEEKRQFFNEIDVLVFPTRYRNEAEPLVILEAMQACCPVISFARGCIGEFIDTECGLLIPKDDAFVPAALERLSLWEAAPEEHAHARKAAYSKFLGARLRAEDAKKELIAILRLERPTGASS